MLFPVVNSDFLYLLFWDFYDDFPKPVLLVNHNFFKHGGGHLRSQSDLRDSISTPKVEHLYGLSLEYFGFSLSAFPILPYYDLLTQNIEFRIQFIIDVQNSTFQRNHKRIELKAL